MAPSLQMHINSGEPFTDVPGLSGDRPPLLPHSEIL